MSEETCSFAGLALDRPQIMGIVNVTPDSFSDGGQFGGSHLAAIDHGLSLADQGASILDVGGESTRPGAAPVSLQEELDRVLPVIEALSGQGYLVSIDTRHAEVMRQAAEAGAGIINDVTALIGEGSLEVAASTGLPVILMHMQGEPQTMQANPIYGDVVKDVTDYLVSRAQACQEAGIAADKICLDPGIGFGKTLEHNLALLNHLDHLCDQGFAVLMGLSRKSFIAKIDEGASADKRLPGTIAGNLLAFERGARLFRVHDVAEARQAFDVWRAMGQA